MSWSSAPCLLVEVPLLRTLPPVPPLPEPDAEVLDAGAAALALLPFCTFLPADGGDLISAENTYVREVTSKR